MTELHAPDLSLSSLLDINQVTSEVISFFVTNSDSMPMVIDHRRVIRYCNPRLREILGYGWQADLVNGNTLIDALVPPDFREEHAQLITAWFRDPEVLHMHARAPLPVMARDGRRLAALIKLVPYEPREKSLRPIFDTPIFYPLGVAFITLLPESWRRYDTSACWSATDHHGGAPGQSPEHPADRRPTGTGPAEARGDYQPPARRSTLDPALGEDLDRGHRPAQRPSVNNEAAGYIDAAIRGLDQYGARRY